MARLAGVPEWLLWALVLWLAAANGVDAAATWRAISAGVREGNPLVAPIVGGLWLVVAKAAALVMCAVCVPATRAAPEARSLLAGGLILASVGYLAVVIWHLAGQRQAPF